MEHFNKNRNQIITSVGKWYIGDTVKARDLDMFEEIYGKLTYTQAWIYMITGKSVSKEVADIFELMKLGVSYPDHRLWCNQISSFAADTKASPIAASSASNMAVDSKAYGFAKVRINSMNILKELYTLYINNNKNITLPKNIKTKDGVPVISGFARPFNAKDERIESIKKLQEDYGIEFGKYQNFTFLFEEYFLKKYNKGMNTGAYNSAFFLDQGFNEIEAYRLGVSGVILGSMACYVDYYDYSPHSFLPKKCNDIEYKGKEIRKLK